MATITKKLEKLSPEQEALISVVRDRAIQRALFDAPEIDIERAHKAMNWQYKKAGLKTPRFFIHVSSPLALQYAANILKTPGNKVYDQVYDQVSDQVCGQVYDQVCDQVRDQVSGQVSGQVRDQVCGQVYDQVCDQVRDQVSGRVRDQVYDQVSDRVRDQVYDQVSGQVSGQVCDQVYDQVCGQVYDQKLNYYQWAWTGLAWDGYWSSFGEYFREIGILKYDDFNQYAEILESGVFMALQFENYAIVCERPSSLARDTENRLHNEHGPAITWRDSYAIYALNGVRLPQELWQKITDKKLTASELTAITDVDQRAVAIKYGLPPTEFIKQLKATLVDEGEPRMYRYTDNYGIERVFANKKRANITITNKLYRVDNFIGTGEIKYFLHYTDPSVNKDHIKFVTPWVNQDKPDADETMAATHHMTKQQYLEMGLEA